MQFDQLIDRSSTYAYKWEKYKGQDVIPLWIADTEFKCAQPIIDAVAKRTEHGLMGYTLPAHHQGAIDAVINWLDRQYGWKIEQEWLVWTPGVVPAFNTAIAAYCEPGDKVIVQSPNYPPLLAAPGINKMQRVTIPTLEQDGRWMLDMAELEKQAADPACKLFILCNPMNPVGTVLNEQELSTIADICEKHNVLLCSDEIHCDLILDEEATHIPAGKLPGLESRSITLMAASKTFNVAGLGTSFAIIPDAKLRQQFNLAARGIVPWVNIMGLEATQAAFTLCDDWHQAQLAYLRDNRDYLYNQINQINGLRMLKPQATFLAWVDARELNVPSPQKWAEDKGVGPSPGADFAEPQFFRLNFGCPRTYLEQAIERLKA
ncbi:MalY/PatB family protein [Neptunicella marina]|uniref:cysteine-S-conjugate beta-lyase n=1 Tax=Neptunicella marina TaxID=2125989 RepID=A0A8J6IV33_9ALTE|nr:PatB family C-S lyase [Neptunicella marina]MBC3767890.1 putative C-S lyase [Neptunicella marina]